MPRTSAIVSSCSLPTPSASQYGSSQNGINGVGGEHERPSAGRPSLITAARLGLLPTPTASDSKRTMGQADRQRSGPTLHEALIAMLPRASDATKGPGSLPERAGGEGVTLPEAINRLAQRGLLPTPTSQDSRATGAAGNWTAESGRHAGVTLTDVAVRGLSLPSASEPSPTAGEPTGTGAARLNPRFVEWMMGLPMAWAMIRPIPRTPTSSTSSATASSPRRRASRSRSSGSDSMAQTSMFPATTGDE